MGLEEKQARMRERWAWALGKAAVERGVPYRLPKARRRQPRPLDLKGLVFVQDVVIGGMRSGDGFAGNPLFIERVELIRDLLKRAGEIVEQIENAGDDERFLREMLGAVVRGYEK